MPVKAGPGPVSSTAMTDAHADRQLLAIMFTDVVGYTAITERDEASAVRIRDAHRDLVRTLVKQFDGEVMDVTGDESLSIFAARTAIAGSMILSAKSYRSRVSSFVVKFIPTCFCVSIWTITLDSAVSCAVRTAPSVTSY